MSFQPAFAGRFEFHQNVQFPAQSILLDTQTGKIWKNTCFSEIKEGNCEIKAWSPESVVGINVTDAEIWKLVEKYNKANQAK